MKQFVSIFLIQHLDRFSLNNNNRIKNLHFISNCVVMSIYYNTYDTKFEKSIY